MAKTADKKTEVVGASEEAASSENMKRLRFYGILATALVFGALGVYTLVFSKADTIYRTSLSIGGTLNAGQSLGSSLTKPAYKLVMQGDGNLVEYRGKQAVWQTNTDGTGSHNYLIMQSDGNLVLYKKGNDHTPAKALWSSRTNGLQRPFLDTLVLQKDGNLVIYSKDKAVWSTYTGILHYYSILQLVSGGLLSLGSTLNVNQTLASGKVNPAYRLVMQGDGNLVEYRGKLAVWQTNTDGTGSHNYLIMQSDGNLVLYKKGNDHTPAKALWSSRTVNTGGYKSYKLLMQSDGNLVIYNDKGKAIWSIKTGLIAG